ncbi:MAG: rod shape-determining protein MreC [Bacteroidota bacterium]
MQRLLNFLYKRREIGVFLVLEILSIWLLVSYNNRYNASFFNSSNQLSGFVSQSSQNVFDYFELDKINERLMHENEFLQEELRKLRTSPTAFLDTINRYQVIGARVVANTVNRSSNFLTISAGKKDGIEVGMGIITTSGIVGQVKSVSNNFATVYSLLHPNLLISSKVKRTQTKGTVQWDQANYLHAELKYIPRHIKLKKGDSVVTSGFNSVFPKDILIGIIDEFDLKDQMTFYKARIQLATDFTSLDHVYAIKDLLKQEKDSLELL